MKKLLLITCLLYNTNIILSQDIGVKQEDAINFLEAYFSPISNSLGSALNNGWYNTARPHKLGGFDITLTLNTVSLNNSQLHFNPNDIPNFYSDLEDANGNPMESTPSILGDGEGAIIKYNDTLNFKMPNQSINTNLIPVPIINIGLGLIKKTEIDGRYIPQYDFPLGFAGSGSIKLWGIGIKHDLMQWIPVVGNTIPVDLSFQIAHTDLKTTFDINHAGLNQDVDLRIQSTTMNLIASKKILMITAYAGIGYNTSQTNWNTNTSFKLGDGDNNISFDSLPLEMEFSTQNQIRTNIGIRINLAILAIQANHTFSKYPVTTLGLGISIR